MRNSGFSRSKKRKTYSSNMVLARRRRFGFRARQYRGRLANKRFLPKVLKDNDSNKRIPCKTSSGTKKRARNVQDNHGWRIGKGFEQSTICHFDRLPNEILLKIFSYLRKLDLTNLVKMSQRFKSLATHELLMRDSSFNSLIFKPERFQDIIDLPIKNLSFDGIHIRPKISPLGKENFRMHLNKLSLLHISYKSSLYILDKCKPKHLFISDTKINMELLNTITNNDRLEVLWFHTVDLVGCNGFTLYCNIFRLCPNLKELDLRYAYLSKRTLRWLCEHIPPSVEILLWNDMDIMGHNKYGNPYNGTSFVRKIASRLPNLKILGVPMFSLKCQRNIHCLAELQFLDTLRFCHCDWKRASLRILLDVLPQLPNIKNVEFMMKERFRARYIVKLWEFLSDLKDLPTHVDMNFIAEFDYFSCYQVDIHSEF